MTSRGRAVVAFCGLALAAVAAGCGGGGSPGAGSTPAPVGTAITVKTRPLQNGDAFAYAGSTTERFVYTAVSPEPVGTTLYAIAQQLTVTGPTAFDGAANAFDVHDAETDTSSLAAVGITTDTYDALVAAGTTTNLVTYGFKTTDTNGESLTVTLPSVGSGNGILDELPESKGQTWSNSGAQTANETSPGGVTSTRVTASDGSYVDTTLYPVGSIYASPGPAISQAKITQNADGSGSYVFYANTGAGGAAVAYDEIDFATPQPAASGLPAQIPISESAPSPSPPATGTVALWYPQPLKLYAESDSNSGAAAIPSGCNVPASLGTQANAVLQTITQYDTILGTAETFSQTNYVVPTYGLICVSLNEKLQFYYDYSGQSNLESGPSFTANAAPIEIETIATTLGLTAATTPADAAVARGLRVTSARSNFVALVEREKLRRKTMLLQALRQAALEMRR